MCGLDFATGKVPAVPAPTPAGPADAGTWQVVVEADREFFTTNEADDLRALTFPADQQPVTVELEGDAALIGRRSASAGVVPDVDLSSDPGVSRRHATLQRSATGWVVVDQGSTNGTRLNGVTDPIQPGVPIELSDGDVLRVGAWSSLTLRRTA